MLLQGEVADAGTCPAPKPLQLMPWVIWEQGKALSSAVAGWSGASSSLPEHSASARAISQAASCDLGRKSIVAAPGGQASAGSGLGTPAAPGSPGQAPWAGRQDHGEHLQPPEAPPTSCLLGPGAGGSQLAGDAHGPRYVALETHRCVGFFKCSEALRGSGLYFALICSSSNFIFFSTLPCNYPISR